MLTVISSTDAAIDVADWDCSSLADAMLSEAAESCSLAAAM